MGVTTSLSKRMRMIKVPAISKFRGFHFIEGHNDLRSKVLREEWLAIRLLPSRGPYAD